MATQTKAKDRGLGGSRGKPRYASSPGSAPGARIFWGARSHLRAQTPHSVNIACAVLGMTAAVFSVFLPIRAFPAQSHSMGETEPSDEADAMQRAQMVERVRYRGDEFLFAAYGGAPYTYASDVRIKRDGTEFTVHDVDWQGKPFDDPIYYGIRVARWFPQSSFGTMLDFMHSKAYAPLDQRVKVTGTKDGAPLPPEAAIGDIFHKLEFTHGHNLLTLNALHRLPSIGSMLSPYVGAGLGAALPHTEVQIKGTPGRTYAYQYAGPAAQFVLGIEIRIPRLSYFVEYKFTSASYRVPLQKVDGDWLPFDLWIQLKRWLSGNAPAGGWASTWLTSHQIIAGMGIRTVPAVAAP